MTEAPYNPATIGFIRGEARLGHSVKSIAEVLQWTLPRLLRVAQEQNIDLPRMNGEAVLAEIMTVTKSEPEIKPVRRTTTTTSEAIAAIRPPRTEQRVRQLTLTLYLTEEDRARIERVAWGANVSMPILVGALVEAANDLNEWERLLGLKG